MLGRIAVSLVAVLASAASAAAWRQLATGIIYPAMRELAGDIVLAGDGTVARLDGATGAEVWRHVIDGGSYGRTLTVDAAGDVIASGRWDQDYGLVKLDGDTGAQSWRVTIDGTGNDSGIQADVAHAVAVDGSGDVVGVGSIYNNTEVIFMVVKLAGATGAELWRRELDPGVAQAVAVDAAGNVIALGTTADGFAVIKLAGATGAELWRLETPGGGGVTGDQPAVTIDPMGDVVAVGRLGNGTFLTDFGVIKLAGSTGAELWRRQIAGTATSSHVSHGSEARAVAITGSGDVVVGGYLLNGGTYFDFTDLDFIVARLAGGSGADVWRRVIDGGRANVVAIDGNGDVIALGHLGPEDFAAMKLHGGTGDTLWDQMWDPDLPPASATSGALSAAGDVFAAGLGQAYQFSGLGGALGPVSGRSLVVKDVAGTPSARSVRITLADRSFVTSPPGSVGDPTLHGATLRVVNPTTLETASISLPAGRWEGVGFPAGAAGYRYRDAFGDSGPCVSARAVPGRFKASCLGRNGTIPFSLDEPTQGSLAASLQPGTAATQCAVFGGTIRRDAGTGNPGPAGTFKAVRADAVSGVCP